MAYRRTPMVILAVVLLILGMGTVRGLMAKDREKYPCAFQRRENSQWFGQLSLNDANRLRAKSVRVGESEPVRLREVTASNAVSVITCLAQAYGMDPGKFLRMGKCESGNNPKNDTHPTFKGWFQYHPDTWNGVRGLYGHAGADILDGYAQGHVTVQYAKAGGFGPWPVCGV